MGRLARRLLFALPGTLLDARSLAPALVGMDARFELLGVQATLDGELDRLAALAPRPAWWLGHSLGGIVALQLAARHPRAVAGLVLLAANARSAAPGLRARGAAQWQVAQQRGLRALAQAKLMPAYGLHRSDALGPALAEQAEAVGMGRFAHQLIYAATRPPCRASKPWLAVPVLALSAGGDALCPPACSDEIVALAQAGVTAQHHCLEPAGHLFPMQHAGWVATRLHAFLNLFDTESSR